jgi:hypothetical protein
MKKAWGLMVFVCVLSSAFYWVLLNVDELRRRVRALEVFCHDSYDFD